MIAQPERVLTTNQSQLQRLLKESGHAVSVAGKCWNIDNKVAYWPETGKFKLTLALGGKSGSLRGSPESNFHQLSNLLKQN